MADVTPPRGGGGDLGAINRELAKLQAQAARIARDLEQASAVASKGGERKGRSADEAAVRRGRSSDVGVIEQENRRATTSEDQLTAARGRSQAALRNSDRLTRENVQAQAQMSQATRRQNALHTDFIQAAAKGNTTLGEMRYQVGATVAKFAGWTLAAGAVYGAVAAVQKLGEGAIYANKAVNQLQQVLPHVNVPKAYGQVSELSRRLNVSPKEIGDTLQEAAKHVNTQEGAFKLAGVAATAEKIFPGLQPDQAIKGLTSITRGFKIPVGEAMHLLDQLTVLSSRFGVSAGDTLVGAAKAAATFRNAGGGSTRTLLAMVGAMNRLGYSSNEAGTAIRRSAEIIKRPGSVNRSRLAAFGIDADQPYGDIIRQAVSKVQSGQVKGKQVNQLATALSTPQLSSRFAAILNRPDIYQRMLAQLGGPGVSGAANRRVKVVLQQVQQQIQAIGLELERLGAQLARAGVFTGLGLMLRTLNETLHLVTELVGLFNQLPEPFRKAAVFALELYGILRLIRRSNPATPGEGIGGGIFRPNQAQFDRRAVRLTGEREVAASKDLFEERLARQGRAQVAVRENAAYADQAIARSQAAPGDKTARAEAARASQRLTRSQLELERASVAASVAGNELAAAEKRAALAVKQLRRGVPAEQVAREAGYPVAPTTFATGVLPREGETYRRIEGAERLPTGALGRGPSTGAFHFTGGASYANLLPEAERATEEVTRNSNAVIRGGQALGRRLPSAKDALGRASTGLRSAGAGLAGLGSQLFGALGPLDILIIGVIGITEALRASQERQARIGKELDKLQKTPTSVGAAKAAQRKAEKDSRNFFENFAANLPLGPYGRQAFGALTGRDVRTNAERERDAARRRTKEAEGIAAARDHAKALGVDVPFLSQSELKHQLADAQSQFNSGKISSKRFKQIVNKLLRENLRSLADTVGGDGGRQAADAFEAEAKAARKRNAPGKQIGSQFRGVPLDTISTELEALGGKASYSGGASSNVIRQATFGYLTAIRSFGHTRDPKEISKLAQARQQFLSVITDEVKYGQDDLKLATSDSQRNSIYRRIFSKVRAPLRESRREQSSLRDIRDKLRKQLQDELASPDQEGGIGGHTPVRSGAQKGRIAKLRQRIKKANSDLRATSKQTKDLEREIKLIQQDLQVQRFDENTDIINQRSEVQSSGTFNKGAQIAIRLRTANRNLARAMSSAFRNTREGEKRINQALIDRNQVLQEQADLALQQIDARGQLSAATAPTEQGALRAQINTAQQQIGLLQSQGRGPEEILPVVADLARLRKQLAQQVIDDAKSLAEASADYAKSLTGSKIKESRIDLGLANKELSLARQVQDPTQRRIQTLQALAKRNEARGALRLQGYQEKFDAIQFRADIGKITPEEELTQVNRLLHSIPKRLLKSVDGLRDFYRDLRRTAHQLKKEIEGDTSGDLQVGNIRLPTIYDVRRLARQGTQTAPQAVVHQQNNITVNGATDAEYVGRTILRTINNGGRAASRAAGVR